MKPKFKAGILFPLVVVFFATSTFVWLRDNTRSSGNMAAQNTIIRMSDEMCGIYSQLNITDNAMLVDCTVSAGHSNTIAIQLFKDSEASSEAFDEWRKEHPATHFHGYPSVYYENEDYLLPGGLQKVMIWRVRHIVFVVTALDDTHFRSAHDPLKVSEKLYLIGREERLIPTHR